MAVTVFKYQDSVADPVTGRPVANVAVSVTDHLTGAASTLYDEDGEPVSAAITTDSLGRFSFRVPSGRYDIHLQHGGNTLDLTDVPVGIIGGIVVFSDNAGRFFTMQVKSDGLDDGNDEILYPKFLPL